MRNFVDISPSDGLYIIDRIKIDTISAKWCDNNIIVSFYLQDELLGTLTVDKKECECFVCPHPYSFITPLNNFTNYNYGGVNSLRVDSGLIKLL